MKVSILGTGIMGSGMARALVRAGHDVSAWNRTPESAQRLAGDGVTVYDTIEAAVSDADAVITMVFDAAAVEEVGTAMGASLKPGAVWLQTSTVGVDGVHRAQRVAESFGLSMIDAPVVGTKAPANDGTLVVLVAGDAQLIERVRPVLEAVSSKIVQAGDSIGQASALKLVCNAWVATLTAGIAQSLAFAKALGLEPELFLEAINGSASDTAYARIKGPEMLSGEFPTSFAVDSLLKDLRLALDAVSTTPANDELTRTLENIFENTSEKGLGASDVAAIYRDF
jgi:3-hydroxyisobutyrate dehydrogenase